MQGGSTAKVSPSKVSPSRKSSPTPFIGDRQAKYKFVLPIPNIELPDSKDVKGERRDLGLPPLELPKHVKDHFYASVINADCRALLTILRDYDCRELVDQKEDHITGTDSWRVRDYTPCHYACKHDHVEVLKILISKGGANANIPADFGLTPAMIAAECGNVECLRVILEQQPFDVDQCDVYGKSCFWLAAKSGNIECMNLLLMYNCQVNIKDHRGMGPLHAAARGDENEEALKFLCSVGGIDINMPDNFNRTPLDCALADSLSSLILEEAGAKPTADDEQVEELRRAAMHGDNVALARILEDYECRGVINIPERGFEGWKVRGYTAMQYAAAAGNATAIALLLAAGADADAAGDDEGNTALLIACSSGKKTVLQEMLCGRHSHLTNIHVVNRAGQGAVYLAVNRNQRESLALLLRQERMDMNRADDAELITPLHLACKHSFELCAKMLLEAGAVVNPRDKNGHTPIGYASQDSLKRLLRKHGAL